MLNNQLVTMSATGYDVGLAWGLTQVSAGVKIDDHKAKAHITGCLLFGASGHKKVQSRATKTVPDSPFTVLPRGE